jgi:hypothetical protein
MPRAGGCGNEITKKARSRRRERAFGFLGGDGRD